jgi:hypothetical protein
MSNNSGSSLVLKIIGFVVVAFVAIFIVKMIMGAIFGAISLLFTLALILLLGYAIVWIVRKL